ncbi:MAG: UMP kinase [Acidobacteria bacterium]|nr:UMP kinase [Acidobacteriota bacterium]
MNPASLKYQRVLLKISGESLLGSGTAPHDTRFLDYLSEEITQVSRLGAQLGIVIGGGNIFRGQTGTALGVERITGDYAGMMATVINALLLASSLRSKGCATQILSPFHLPQFSTLATAQNARQFLSAGQLVLFCGGTGNPFFTTDSAAVLRALESGCEAVLKATRVRGIFEQDPEKHPSAKFIPHLSFDEAIARDIRVMDQTAFAMCREQNLPIIVFDIQTPGNIRRAVCGETVGSIVDSGP